LIFDLRLEEKFSPVSQISFFVFSLYQKSQIKNSPFFLSAIVLQLIENSESKSQTSKCVMMLAYGSPRGG
jgi:hypothetical protein